jgi:HSP20 family protein
VLQYYIDAILERQINSMQEQAKIQHIPIKMYRTSERLVIAVPMPGLEPEDILVKVTESSVVMQGDIRGLLKDVKELLIDEWSVGSYYREVPLPNSVDGEHANVTYGNGVLVVNLPISEKTVTATLVLDKTGIAHGERVGNAKRA